jgi:hypothetical protein
MHASIIQYKNAIRINPIIFTISQSYPYARTSKCSNANFFILKIEILITFIMQSQKMSEKEFDKLMELAQKQLHEKVSDEEALRSFVRAGILDENGNLTALYASLAVPPRQ